MSYRAKDCTVQINGITVPVKSFSAAIEKADSCGGPGSARQFLNVPDPITFRLSPAEPRERVDPDPELFDCLYSLTFTSPGKVPPRQRFLPHPHNRRWRRRRAYCLAKQAIPPQSLRFDGVRLKSMSPGEIEFVTVPSTMMRGNAGDLRDRLD